jgi:hypothetical protein
MTRALDVAIAKLAALPADEQDRIARWLLEELRDEEQWAQQFAASQDAPRRLAAEARAERAAGRVTDVARTSYRLFQENPRHPSRDREPIYSVRVSLGYRALGLLGDDEITRLWIGTHADDERLLDPR